MKLVALALLFLSSGLSGRVQSKPVGQAVCPDTLSSTGRYENHSYGFSVVIPKNVQGLWNSAMCVSGADGCTCMSDHGRIIPLGSEPYEPERHIEMYAGYAADLDAPTVQQEIDKHVEWVRERSRQDSVAILRQSNRRLGGLKARRAVLRYFDKKLDAWMIEDVVEALRGRDIEYSVYLRTREKAYKQDVRVFESVVNSFRLGQLQYLR